MHPLTIELLETDCLLDLRRTSTKYVRFDTLTKKAKKYAEDIRGHKMSRYTELDTPELGRSKFASCMVCFRPMYVDGRIGDLPPMIHGPAWKQDCTDDTPDEWKDSKWR